LVAGCQNDRDNETVAAVYDRVNELESGIFPCLQRRDGRAIKKWSRSEKARTGWPLASYVSECGFKHLPVSDHPVCDFGI